MFNWKILLVSLVVLLIAMCSSEMAEILSRPGRPEKFTNHQQLQDYLSKLKTFHQIHGQRYRKRLTSSSPTKFKYQFLPENWQDIYEIVKHYYEK